MSESAVPDPVGRAGGSADARGATGAYDDAGHALVAVARAFGCDAIFGVISIHNLPLVHAACAAGIFVPMRHEAATVNAADAYARATGRLGIAVTSTGTGAGNAAGSLIEALTAGSRVLHVTGQIDAEYVGLGRGVIHETKDQPAMLDAVSKAVVAVQAGDEVGTALYGAAEVSTTAPCGPVSVEIPIDLQYRATKIVATDPVSVPAPDSEAVAAAVAAIEASSRPVLWLGGGAVEAGADLERLVELTGAGVFTSNAGRGTIDEQRDDVIGNFAAQNGAELLADADLLITVGSHFRSNETRHYKLNLPDRHIQIDVDPAAIGRVYPASVGIVGDASAVIAAINQGLQPVSAASGWRDRVVANRTDGRDALRRDIGPYAELCDAMRDAFDPASPFVRDVTIPASVWGNRLFPVSDPRTNINPRGGGIGQGLAMGIGAALGRPDVPTLLMVGDGGLAVHLGELGAAAQAQPWLVIALFNDGGYGVLRNLQDAHFGRRAGVDLATPDFAGLAAAYELAYLRLDCPDAAREVLGDAIARHAPVIVEIDCAAFGEMPTPFVPPVPVQSA